MARILFIIILLIVSFMAIKRIKQRLKLKDHSQFNEKLTKKPNEIVKCLECGIHFPEHEAITQGQRFFCSLDHARKYLER